MHRLAIVLGLGLVWCVRMPSAWAVTRVWDGGGADALASTGDNWCNGDSGANEIAAPSSGDDVRFGGATVGSCVPHASKSATWNLNLGGYALNSWTMSATTTAYTGTVTLGIALDVNSALTLASGGLNTSTSNYGITAGSYSQSGGTLTANGSTITIDIGDWSKTGGTFTAGTSTVSLQALGNFTPGAATTYYNVTFGASGQTYTLQSNALSVSNTLTITGMTLNTNGTSNLAVSTTHFTMTGGTFTANASTIIVNGNFTKTGGTFTAGSWLLDFRTAGNVNFNPGGAGTTYYNVQIIKGSGYAVTLQSDLKVSNQLKLNSISSGAIAPGAYTITLTGVGTGTSAPFLTDATTDLTAGTSTIQYTGTSLTTQIDVAALPYYDLAIDTAIGQFNFVAGATTTVSHFMSLRGADATNKLILRSTSAGVQATLTVSGSYSVSYVDVNDINSCSGNSIIAFGSNTIGANASCWSSSQRVPTGPGPGSQPATY